MKLTKRFLILSIVIASFSCLFYLGYKDVKDKTLKDFNNQQFILAKQTSRGIESFFIYYQRELSFLSKIKYVTDLNEQGKNLLADFYNSHSDQIEAITLVDPKGVLKYTYPLNSKVIGQDISDQQHIQTLMRTHQPTLSDVFTSIQGFRAIAYHVPIIAGNEYKGSVAILIPLEKLGKRFVENIRTGETGYGWMISKSGIELFSPSTNQTGKNVRDIYRNDPSVLTVIEKASTDTAGISSCYIKAGAQNENQDFKALAFFYRVPLVNTFWTILIFTPETEVYANLTSFRNRLYILISMIIIVMSIYFYLMLKANNILKEEKKRKVIEKTLIESEKRFRVMFELSPAGIILIDESGKVIEVNTAFCNALGYSRKEIIGNNIRVFTMPANEDEITKNISRILSGHTLIHETDNIRKDGSLSIQALYETKIILPDGTSGILTVSNDITETKKSHGRMLTLSRALESIGECVSITDFQNKLIFVNNAFCRCYGYTEEEVIGKDISILRTKGNEDLPFEKIISDTMNSGWTGELMNVRKDGSEFPIELSTSNVKDEKGNPVALIGIAVDITERKKIQTELIRAKEKAEESDKLKSSFLANMSHELRTPLNAIIGFSGLIIGSGPDKDTIPYSEMILKSGQHLLNLVEDIFDITMIESGQLKINCESAKIVTLLNEVKDFIYSEGLMENKNSVILHLNLDKISNDAYIETDQRKLKQVLMNLLRNAIKFTDKGSVEFGLSEITENGNKLYKFFVSDSGIGIDKSYHEAIFKIFRQIDDTHTRKVGGMGVGLSIAKRIVEILGGKIWVESEPAKGSTFYFTIPASQNNNEQKELIESKTLVMEKNYDGKTVLIAEDEKSNFDFLRILLNRMNINVLWARDGNEAVSICENVSSVNLVLMDIKMPNLNGYDASRLIKSKRPDLPIIAQTAYAMKSDKIDATNAGCDGYLAKPIKIKQINEVLEKYL